VIRVFWVSTPKDPFQVSKVHSQTRPVKVFCLFLQQAESVDWF